MTDLVGERAAKLWRSTLAPDDRVLVVGASGWFGRTAVCLTSPKQPMLAIASAAREVRIGDRALECFPWDEGRVRDFAPTVVADCAFLTRDRLPLLGVAEYLRVNRSLNDRLLWLSGLHGVRRLVTISSGAAVHPVDAITTPVEEDPYGHLKRDAELRLLALTDRRAQVGIARAWSVTGPLAIDPGRYAFSDMVRQARDATSLRIAAAREVYRRYSAADDLLAVTLALAASPIPVIVDSGGELLELGELASIIIDRIRPGLPVHRPESSGEAADRYHSDGRGWAEACAKLTFEPQTLVEQIDRAVAALPR